MVARACLDRDQTAVGFAGALEDPRAPLRRCVATGASADKDLLLRFVLDPENRLILDLDAKLPGRGLYLTPTAEAIALAVKKRGFARSARRAVEVPADLGSLIETRLVTRMQEAIGLARRAGAAVCGFDQVEAWLRAGRVAALLQACDAAEGGRAKLSRLAGPLPVLESLTAIELARPFGRDHLVHVAIGESRLARRLTIDSGRIKALRDKAGPTGAVEQEVRNA